MFPCIFSVPESTPGNQMANDANAPLFYFALTPKVPAVTTSGEELVEPDVGKH
jgi:hypothetical protein